MDAVDARAASIRMFTVPGRHVGTTLVRRYATVAAEWERLRLELFHDLVHADDERFLELSVMMQRLSTELGLQTCNAKTAGTDDVAGITGWRGFLPNDPGYLQSGTWSEAAETWWGRNIVTNALRSQSRRTARSSGSATVAMPIAASPIP
ncbi:hypothetical protein [Mycobacterium sp.]|uniref:hypothetical protein n=1 Tax=Mycobacterium sp. TaxID=1785 RepID=UPI002B89F790|nr:hypothetical protein [Mycobacterium sp.]HME48710.1 hypothetical protein [Mycobacterium sp.]